MNFFGNLSLLVVLLIGFNVQSQNETVSPNLILEFENEAYRELSLSEWKKFKNFEKKLVFTPKNDLKREQKLRAYTRDSLQILGVKLMAVKLLNEKKLLDRDIAENTLYYEQLLTELHDSAIPKTEYLFLEEKMALLNQRPLEKQLAQSRWLNLGLLALSIILGLMVFILRNKRKLAAIPELSRQEHTVRNLILQGKTNKEIADELFISLSTVKSHITNIYSKLQVSGRSELLQKHTGTST